MDDIEPPTSEYYRDKAQEIRQWRGVPVTLKSLVSYLNSRFGFDRMAAYADKRKLTEAAV